VRVGVPPKWVRWDEDRRRRVYREELTVLSPGPFSLALPEHAQDQIEGYFAPHQPEHAHEVTLPHHSRSSRIPRA
jgi:hypothetical protein